MIDSNTAERYYRETHQIICDLVTTENEQLPVPACPEWTLHDLLAHLTGVMQDFLSRNTEGAPGPEWTAAQVERYRDVHIEAVKSAWRESLDKAGPVFRAFGGRLLPDIVTHELDVRGALGNTDARNTERLKAAVGVLVQWADLYYRESSLPAMELRLDGNTYLIGEGSPEISLTTSHFEASRVLTGRRSAAQNSALDWSADPSPWLDHLSTLGRRVADLNE